MMIPKISSEIATYGMATGDVFANRNHCDRRSPPDGLMVVPPI